MKLNTKKQILMVLLPMLLLAGASAIAWYISSQESVPEKIIAAKPAVSVEVLQASFSDVTMTVHSQGVVTPVTTTELSSSVGGKIVTISPKLQAGGFFEKGEQLLSIDTTRYEAAVAQCKANIARAELNLLKTEASAAQSEHDWQRLGKGAANSLTLYKPQLHEAQAVLNAEKAACKLAQQDLVETRIVAPYSCRIKSMSVSLGLHLEAGAPVASIFATDAAEIRLPVRSSDLYLLDTNIWGRELSTEHPLEVDLYAKIGNIKFKWQTQIVRSEGIINQEDRMTYIVARIKNPYDQEASGNPILPIGLHVQAEIAGRNIPQIIKLPLATLTDQENIMVVDINNRLHKRKVKVLGQIGDEILVSEGLEEGERVCINSLNYHIEGQQVTVTYNPLIAGVHHE